MGTGILYRSSNFITIKVSDDRLIMDTDVWDPAITRLVALFEAIYFKGSRENYADDVFDRSFTFADAKFPDPAGKNKKDLLIRLKPEALVNKRLLRTLFERYEFASLVFLGDLSDESNLIRSLQSRGLLEFVLYDVNNVLIMSARFLDDRVDIQSDVDLRVIFKGSSE